MDTVQNQNDYSKRILSVDLAPTRLFGLITQRGRRRLKAFTKETCNYICFGHELCPTTQKPHLQGYIEWSNGTSSLSALKTLLGKSNIKPCPIRIEPGRECRAANTKYCSKNESADPAYPVKFFELAFVEKQQGKRSDLDPTYNNIHKAVQEGKSMYEIGSNFPEQIIKYRAGIRGLISDKDDQDCLDANKALFDNWEAYKVATRINRILTRSIQKIIDIYIGYTMKRR